LKKHVFGNIFKAIGILACVGIIAFNYSATMSSLRQIPEHVHVLFGEQYTLPFTLNAPFSVELPDQDDAFHVSMLQSETLFEATGKTKEKDIRVCIKAWGIPVKEILLQVRNNVVLTPGGSSIGVTLHTRGALVVGVSSVHTQQGELSPAAAAGIQPGDLIELANGEPVKNAAHLADICNHSTASVDLMIQRAGEQFHVRLKPVLDRDDQQYRMGMWVRDSTAGVGTLSFYDQDSGWYAALGHAVMDADTRSNLTVGEGEIVQSDIVDIVQGSQGEPGELRGIFNSSSMPLGTIEANGDFGIYGKMYQPYHNPLFPDGVPMAFPEEADLGPAKLLTTLNDEGVSAYDCEIVKINAQSSASPKGMVVQITDERLLDTTGGIVQGMSGSPLIQNGKLIGVVTHVFINDPTRGYCMYTQWMQDQINALNQ